MHTPHKSSHHIFNPARSGFTLIELMVVIAIIAVLVAMTVPVVGRAIDSARRGQASTEVKSIEAALLQYYNEYGRFPHGNDPGGSDYVYGEGGDADNRDLMNVLRAINSNESQNPGDGIADHSANPRRIVFLEIPDRSLSDDGDYVDPWGEQYNVLVDTSFDGNINVSGTYEEIQNRRVAVWTRADRELDERRRHIHSWNFSE